MENNIFFNFFSHIRAIYHWLWALWGVVRYRFPSRKLIVIGITGTNGKSTTVALLHEMFRKAGYSVGSLSSLRFKINDTEETNTLKMTMPGRGAVQAFLRRSLNAGCRYAILEVTSEGIRQHRHAFVLFDAVAFTNLTPEHIESHGSFEAYRAMKQRLFRAVARRKKKIIDGRFVPAVLSVNLDDSEYTHFLMDGADRTVGYTLEGRKDSFAQYVYAAGDVRVEDDGVSFTSEGERFHAPLSGFFNVSNIMAALSLAREYAIPMRAIASALSSLPGVPGRFEYIREGQPFEVIVDYAHTPDAMKKVYETIKIKHPQSRMICVFGAAGGGRDAWKRPEFGAIAASACRSIILTDEDPYDENPESIIADIRQGVPATASPPISVIRDRREAIGAAIGKALPGDVVMITGKGAEPWLMGPRGTKIPWDDRAIAREAVRRRVYGR